MNENTKKYLKITTTKERKMYFISFISISYISIQFRFICFSVHFPWDADTCTPICNAGQLFNYDLCTHTKNIYLCLWTKKQSKNNVLIPTGRSHLIIANDCNRWYNSGDHWLRSHVVQSIRWTILIAF